MSTTPDRLRTARAGALGSVILLLTLIGHTAGHGALPTAGGLFAAGALAFAVGSAVARRRLHLPALVTLLLATQAVLHVVLNATSPHGGGSTGGAMLLGHVAAAIAAAVVIDRGEQVLARWIAYLAQAIGGSADREPALQQERPAAWPSVGHGFSAFLTYVVVRRGPPAPTSPLTT